ncbi:MAG: amidohydrolase family protein [Acidobacteriota bacterium]|nr:amidohydrolase family protein [Acidobacteriota bacterium]MDP2389511.1 amidohydrolase family protein [Acidobacteriota bacterium]
MIIDCHTHLNNYHDETVESLSADIEKLQAVMRRNRVDVALVLTSYKVVPGRPSARAVVEATRHLPHIHIVAGISWATFGAPDLLELRSLLEAGSIKALKLYPGYEPFYPADPKLTPAYLLAEEFDVPVMIHTGDTYAPTGKVKYAHPLHVDEVAVDFPRVKFLICHLGNPWFRDCMEVVYKNENVYTDISGLTLGQFTDRFEAYMRQQLKEMILWGVNPNRVLYGTDWPLASMESYLAFMEELKLPARDKDLMFFENAAALFKLDVKRQATGFGSFLSRL